MSNFEQQIRTLLLDAACRQVVPHLERAGHRPIMLKGATVAGWLYPSPAQRTYQDLDILVAPDARSGVIASLAQLGYRSLVDERMLRTYSPEETPLADDRGVAIDLHTTLKGVRLPQDRAWALFDEATVPWNWAGTQVRALAPHARALHLALHVAQRGLVDGKAAADLALGLRLVDPDTWQRAAELAQRLDAVGSFVAGLELLPEGAALLETLQVAGEGDLETRLRAGSASSSAVFLEQALSARTWAQRLQIVRGRMFPSAGWLRLYEPEVTETRWGMVRARAKRPLDVAARLPAAFRERRAFRKPTE